MGLKSLVKQVFVNKNNMRYENELQSHQVPYGDWISTLERSFCASDEESPGQERAGDVLFICNPDGCKAEHAAQWAQMWFERFPEALVLYGDEDVKNGDGERSAPYFKPDWSPDLFDSMYYLGGLVAVRKSWLENCDKELFQDIWTKDAKDCRQKLIRRVVELAGGYEKGVGRRTILHIPRILFHGSSEESRLEWMGYDAPPAEQAKQEKPEGMLSIIIPSKDNPKLLRKCLEGILRVSAEPRYEIIVVDNGSEPEKREEIEAILRDIRQRKAPGFAKLLYHYDPMPFHFSRMCNLGVRKASGSLLLFLNDDVELVEPGCIRKMACMARRPYTGAVGLKLLYPREKGEDRIQHAGIVNLPMGPVHKLQFCQDREVYYFGWNRGRHNALAVTAACLMIEKRKFQEAGGFEEELAVAFNDVDLCYKLYEIGYENVCECDSYAFHDESYSRGDDESPEKLARLLAEREKLYGKHPGLDGSDGKACDPYYSVYLNREGLDTRIRPVYETAGNQLQQTQPEMTGLDGYRQDPCLQVRVESVIRRENSSVLTGWSVILGDNNACYEKKLLLQSGESGVFGIPLQGQYRPDLEENMPDQENVGLSGFWVEIEDGMLPEGCYQVGVAANRTVGRMKLVNWSNRMVEI